MDETWLYHYDPETKQQSMEWRHSGSPRPAPKNSEWKNQLEKFSPRFFGIKKASSSLSSKGPNYQHGVLLTSAGAKEGRFEGKTPREGHQGGLAFCTTMPRLIGHLQHLKKLTYPGFQCFDHPPYSPDLAPSNHHLVPGLKKNN